MTAISDKYASLGGAAGFLGSATSAELPDVRNGLRQEFQYGSIYWHADTGAFEVHGEIRGLWLALGGTSSEFGYPKTDETSTVAGGGRFNDFEGGAFYWHPSTGAHEMHGSIYERWKALGGVVSMGFPTTDQQNFPAGYSVERFEHGSIYKLPGTSGTYEVRGPILARWVELKAEHGMLGYPVGFPHKVVRNRVEFEVQQFNLGRIEVDGSSGRVYVAKHPNLFYPNYSVPVVAYRVSDSDGTNQCSITVDEVQQWVDEANLVYASAGIWFAYDRQLRDLADTEVNNLPTGAAESVPNWPAIRNRLNAIAAQHRSILLVHRAHTGGGFSSTAYDFVAMSFFDAPNRNALTILAHELGHYLGLPHTHGVGFKTIRDAEDHVLAFDGDLTRMDGDRTIIDDTPPDPFIEELQTRVEIDGITLAGIPLSFARKNVMSYWDHGGKSQLSNSQIHRVREVLNDRATRLLNVTTQRSGPWPPGRGFPFKGVEEAEARLVELTRELVDQKDGMRRAELGHSLDWLRSEIEELRRPRDAGQSAA